MGKECLESRFKRLFLVSEQKEECIREMGKWGGGGGVMGGIGN